MRHSMTVKPAVNKKMLERIKYIIHGLIPLKIERVEAYY